MHPEVGAVLGEVAGKELASSVHAQSAHTLASLPFRRGLNVLDGRAGTVLAGEQCNPHVL